MRSATRRRRKLRLELLGAEVVTEFRDKKRYRGVHGVLDASTGVVRWACPIHGVIEGHPRSEAKGSADVDGPVTVYPCPKPAFRRDDVERISWAEYRCSHADHIVRVHYEYGGLTRITLGPEPQWYDNLPPKYEFPVLSLILNALRRSQQ